mgnify:CR=1 FL=1
MTTETIIPSGIESLMTGVKNVALDSDGTFVQIEYTDGVLESAELTPEEISAGRANVFAFVSAVQSRRTE